MTRLVFETKRMKVAELGEESSVPDLFGELTTQNSLVFDLDEDDEIYEGYGKVNSAFPYRQLNGYTRELHEKDVKTAVLCHDGRYDRENFIILIEKSERDAKDILKVHVRRPVEG